MSNVTAAQRGSVNRMGHAFNNGVIRGGDAPASHGKSFSKQTMKQENDAFAAAWRRLGK